MKEDNTLLKRLGRYAQVSKAGAMAGAAYWRQKDQEQLAQVLFDYAAQLRGPLMKIPQLLAMVPDLLPPAYQERFLNLQANVPPMGKLFVQRRMGAELGPNWRHHFAHFETQATFAASLGQVHQGTLPDGTLVACKLQYPDMAATVAADLTQLTALLKLYTATGGVMNPQDVLAEIREHLPQELDYVQEAHHILTFRKIFAQVPYIQVPQPIMPLTTPRLLTMTWLEGRSILTYKEADQDTRNTLATRLFQAWYTPLYHHGMLHADPHMGNYTVDASLHINVLDFGCVRHFEPQVVQGIVDLYKALLHNNTQAAEEAFHLWGFTHLTPPLLEALLHWARFLYGPVLVDRSVDLTQEFSTQQGQKIATHVLQQLRAMGGGLTPPRTFLFLDRAAVGMGAAFLHLGAKVNWHQLYEELIQKMPPTS